MTEIGLNIIPKPIKINILEGFSKFGQSTKIFFNSTLEKFANFVFQYAKEILDLDLIIYKVDDIEKYKDQNGLFLNLIDLDKIDNAKDKETLSKTNAYILLINNDKILIYSVSENGLFYGIQTIRQIFYNLKFKNKNCNLYEISNLKIEDFPKYEWRGVMLDEARHFQGKQTILKILDLMALLKLNKFHWHLSDDQGWRIEIKSYPKLHQIGSKRNNTQFGGYLSKKFEDKPHEGYYNKEDIKEIINYAKERFIEIIPEIDMPGHSMAALAAYPEFSCKGKGIEVSTTFGIKKDVYCIGNENTFVFLQNILKEIFEIFPSNYIHIGGDEVPLDRWKSCEKCQKKLQELNSKDERDLQRYFTQKMCKFILENNKIPIGWNEILTEDYASLDSNIIVQYWMRKNNLVKKHMKNGRKFIISKFGSLYFDYNYFLTPLKKVYKFNPCFKGLSKNTCKNILGMECTIWTEWIYNERRLFWQLFPRLFAVSEICWIDFKNRDYTDFEKRLPLFNKILDKLGINYEKIENVNPKFFSRISKIIRLKIINPYGGI